MPYAAIEDMVTRYGEAEMARLTTPEGQLDDIVVSTRIAGALGDATALIDTYLRRRYVVPLVSPLPREITNACCILARFDLAHGEQREPTEQMRLAKKDVIAWLEAIADGRVVLDGAIPAAGSSGAGAMTTDRDRMFSPDAFRCW